MKPSQEHSDAIFYQIAADEVKNGNVDDGLLAKAAVKAEGDKKKAEALYIEWRVALLIEQAAEDAKFADADAKKTKDVDNFGWLIAIVPAIIIIVALMLKSPSKTQKVIVIQPPGISIHKAADIGNIEAVKQHLAAGADVNAKDDDNGMNPLHDAAMYGRKEILELLISEGADVNAKDNARWTPLHYAGGSKEVAELLIANGADVNAKNDGAEWNAKNKDGDTPLDVMQAEGDLLDTSKDKASKKEVATLLRKHGGKTGEELKAEGI